MKKSIIAGAIVALMSTSVFANENFKIEGSATGLAAGCSFFAVTDGSMAWDESVSTWYTQNPAAIRIKTRDVVSVDITNDGQLRDTVGAVDTPESIDYTDSTVNTENARNAGVIDPVVTEDKYSVTELAGGNVLNIKVDHTVKTTDSFVALNDVAYHVQNTATCVQ